MSTRVKAHPAVIGAFVVGAIALAVAGMFIFGAASKLFTRKYPVVMFFDDNVNGLAVGAQVAYRGIKLGTVTEIHSVVGSPKIAVAAKLERGPFLTKEHGGAISGEEMQRALEEAVKQGLRAQLALQSFLTGQLYVSLILRPDLPAHFARLEPGPVEIPTIVTVWTQLEAGLQKVPLVDVPVHLYQTLEGTARLLQGPALAKTLDAVGPLLADVQTLVRRIDKEIGPLLVSVTGTSDTARGTLQDVTRQLDQVVADLRPKASQLVTSLTQTSDTARGAVAGLEPQAGKLITSLTETSDTARGTVKGLGDDVQKTLAQLTPQITALAAKLQTLSDTLRGTLDTTNSTIRNVDGTLNGDSPLGHQLTQTLREAAAAARALQTLTDYLERNPESLLMGKSRGQGER